MKDETNETIKHFIKMTSVIPRFLIGITDKFRAKKLKVCLISYHYEEPIMSGVGVHVKFLARYLAKNGCEVHVFCSGIDNSVYSKDGIVVHDIERIRIPLDDPASRKRFNYLLFEYEAIRQVIRTNQKVKFDIIHSHGIATKSSFILKKVLNIKWVHTFHAVETARVKKLIKEEQRFDDWISWMESNVNFCDGAIYVSKALEEEGKKHYSIKLSRIIPNGVDFNTFRFSRISRNNLLFIGRFSKEKGVDIFPSLLKEVIEKTNATVTMISPSNLLEGELKIIKSKITSIIEKNRNRIVLIEKAIDQENIADFYADCQVYIQPSKYESFGLCILEAMASGRPVVTFDVGGTREVVGDAGFAVNSKKEFSRKVISLLNDKDKCEKIGKKASIRSKYFDWDNISKEVIKYYEEIIG